MTAPDPGLTDHEHEYVKEWCKCGRNEFFDVPESESRLHVLTDLIAAALGDRIMHTNGSGDRNRAYAAHVALVVEQHTNGRIAELYEQRDNAIEAGLAAIDRADAAEATIARMRAVEAEYLDPEDTDIECREDVWRFIRDLRAALEWKELVATGVTRVD
ncbi:hypothetical protein [Rhodococcus qingshengii]|uniref:hypothetical protein n=1 Tax=Rhodococcus qingshengii TaxID=334542 RepID=UPI001C8B4B5D|nr:hypothetical protein [Rhodococcus qingshengii]MBX9150051.1 hypothetical protein [Rhodococcus qingshengii]